ncbi:MAG: hypothetical protein K0S97_2716 [Chloroflexota bacterium]|nr:hypothetical protein [Chloroflexota bacterium]
MGELVDLVAEWRERERRLEAGLDREVARRLHELRAEHARLVSGSSGPRRAFVGALDPPASTRPTDRRTLPETASNPAVPSVILTNNSRPSGLAAWRRR